MICWTELPKLKTLTIEWCVFFTVFCFVLRFKIQQHSDLVGRMTVASTQLQVCSFGWTSVKFSLDCAQVLIAAFSVSPYAATYYRAGQKPFNPLLGETYECIREDRGWR